MIPVGQAAPAFELPDTDAAPVALSELGRPALLVFLPAAFTPLCSGELDALAEVRDDIERARTSVLGIACDSVFALRTWAEQLGERAPRLLSDFWPHGRVSTAYGAFDDLRGLATRTSYLVDDGGTVRWSARSPAGVARDMHEHRSAVERLVGAT